MSSRVARASLVGVALVAVAWLALGYRAVALEDKGKAVLERAQDGAVPAAEVNEAVEWLRAAQQLNADRGPEVTEGLLLVWGGRKRKADGIARRVTQAEPENSSAWILAFIAAPNPARAAQARAKTVTLDFTADTALPRPGGS